MEGPARRTEGAQPPRRGEPLPARPPLVTLSSVRLERSRWWWVTIGVGLVALSLLEATFLVSDLQTRRWLFALGCLVVVATGATALVAWIRDRGERVDGLVPGTALGRWALLMPPVAALWILVVVASGGIDVGLLAALVVLIGCVVGVASTVSAVVAVLRHGERSWLVIVLGLVPGPCALFFVVGQLGLTH